MRGEDKQHASPFFIAVQEAVRGPGRSEHRMARADRQPIAAKERVKPPLLDDDRHFGMWIDASWNPSIRRDGYLLNVERLTPLTCAHQDADLQPRGGIGPFAQILFVDDRHLYTFQDLPNGNVDPGNAGWNRCITALSAVPAHRKAATDSVRL